MVKFASIISAGAFLPLLAYSAPSFTQGDAFMPAHAKRYAMDEVNRRIIAFDNEGRELGKYPLHAQPHSMRKRADAAGNCVTLGSDEAQKLKGFSKMEDQAKKNWGDGKHKVVTNDKDFPDSPAQVCSDDAGVNFQYDGDPTKSCHETDNDAQGTLENGKVILENQEGQTLSGTTTVTKSTTIGTTEKMSASFKFPEIVDISAEISFTAEFTNTLSTAQTVGEDHRSLQRLEQPVDGSTDCHITLSTKNCQISATGTLKLIAQGMVWFEYDDKVQDHYKWGLDIASTLTDVNDRSEDMEFKHLGESDTYGHFSASGCSQNATAAPAS